MSSSDSDISEVMEHGARLQALIDSSPFALVEFGLDRCIRLWNPAAERIFGWSRAEMLGRGGLPLAPLSKRGESEELFARVRAGESVTDFETVRQRKDATLVDVSISAAPVRDGSGRVIGNMVAYTDITYRKAQEAEVNRLNAELRARLEELAASRARIITAGDVERRRLERNLHDGAQQRLVALLLSLRLALTTFKSNRDAARAAIASAVDELTVALEDVRPVTSPREAPQDRVDSSGAVRPSRLAFARDERLRGRNDCRRDGLRLDDPTRLVLAHASSFRSPPSCAGASTAGSGPVRGARTGASLV
jgi:PAS domain S-box-containing protein